MRCAICAVAVLMAMVFSIRMEEEDLDTHTLAHDEKPEGDAKTDGGDDDGDDQGAGYGPEELVRRIGVFRGVALTTEVEDPALREVLKFKTEILKKGPEELRMRVLMTPDVETTQGSIESTKASTIDRANEAISAYGTSALKSESFSAGLSIDTAFASANLNVGVSSETQGTTEGAAASAQQMTAAAHTYTNSRYYFEPRAVLKADPDVVTPTDQFLQAVAKIGDAYTVDDLFKDFGTHTCTKVLLGGWWRITASLQSKTLKSAVDMSRMTSSAIDEKSSMSVSGGASYGVASVEASYDAAQQSSSTASQNNAQKQSSSTEDSVLRIYNEWKGGTSGGSEAEWRGSLDRENNYNWKIIDRYVDSCVGIWRWVDDQDTKLRICRGWERNFVEGLGMDYDEQKSHCTGNANMQELRATLIAERETTALKKAGSSAALLAAAKKTCEAVPGFHLDESLLTQQAWDDAQQEEAKFVRIKKHYCKAFTENKKVAVGKSTVDNQHLSLDDQMSSNPPHGSSTTAKPTKTGLNNCQKECADDTKCNGFDTPNPGWWITKATNKPKLCDGEYGILGANGNYLSAYLFNSLDQALKVQAAAEVGGGGAYANCEKGSCLFTHWETFQLTLLDLSEYHVSIKNVFTGKYLTASDGGTVDCNKDVVHGWEEFTLVPLDDKYRKVAIKTKHGKYLRIRTTDGGLDGKGNTPGDRETFNLELKSSCPQWDGDADEPHHQPEFCNLDRGSYEDECLPLGGSMTDWKFDHHVKAPKGSYCRVNVCFCGANADSATGPECLKHGTEVCTN